MGSMLPELSLDLRPVYVPSTVSSFLREVSMIGEISEKLSKLEDYVRRLEDEMRKIKAFRRELPLCMLLLNDAIVRVKEEAMQCKESDDRPVVEEFIPLTKNSGEDEGLKVEGDCKDQKDWMSSAQLWNANINHDANNAKLSLSELKQGREENSSSACEIPFQQCNYRTGGGAFVPFKGNSAFPATAMKGDTEVLQVQGLSLMTLGLNTSISELGFRNSNSNSSCRTGLGSSSATDRTKAQSTPQQQQQTNRKQRRCWSPELHRRFVHALQQLGGWQAATPKQIRELMQVDGLTNDEVKSHLQKYRLHVRRLPASSAAPVSGAWIAEGQCRDLTKRSISQSGSPEGPLHLSGSAKGMSITGGDSMEEEEEEKSESHNSKGRLHRPK